MSHGIKDRIKDWINGWINGWLANKLIAVEDRNKELED